MHAGRLCAWFAFVAGVVVSSLAACTALSGVSSITESECPAGCDGSSGPEAAGDAANDATIRDSTAPPDAPVESSARDTGVGEASAGDSGVVADAGPPPITYVQGNAGSSGADAGGIVVVPFKTALSAHDAVIVGVDYNYSTAATTVASVTDTLGNAYKQVLQQDASGARLHIVLAEDVAGGPDLLTITLTTPPKSFFEVYIHEYAGLALAAAFDVGAGATGTSSAIDGMASGFATTSFANELIFGYGVTGTADAGTGFTPRLRFHDNITEDETVAAPGSYQATATMTAGTGWVMTMGAFRGQ